MSSIFACEPISNEDREKKQTEYNPKTSPPPKTSWVGHICAQSPQGKRGHRWSRPSLNTIIPKYHLKWVYLSTQFRDRVDPSYMSGKIHTFLPANIHNFSISWFPDFHTSKISVFLDFPHFYISWKRIVEILEIQNLEIWCAIFDLSFLVSVPMECIQSV